MNINQLLSWGRENPDVTWSDISSRIESIWGVSDVWIDPCKGIYYKNYSKGETSPDGKWVPFTRGDVWNQFNDDVRHLDVEDVLFWGSVRFGLPCHSYKIEFRIVGFKNEVKK
jgi:hypothetical protein